jgi:hypothetical protein
MFIAEVIREHMTEIANRHADPIHSNGHYNTYKRIELECVGTKFVFKIEE